MWKWKIFWHVIYDINLLILNDGIYNICFCVIQKEKKQIFCQFFENKLAYFYGTNRDYWGIVKCVILFVEKSQKSQKNFEKNEKNEKRNRFCNSEREKKENRRMRKRENAQQEITKKRRSFSLKSLKEEPKRRERVIWDILQEQEHSQYNQCEEKPRSSRSILWWFGMWQFHRTSVGKIEVMHSQTQRDLICTNQKQRDLCFQENREKQTSRKAKMV